MHRNAARDGSCCGLCSVIPQQEQRSSWNQRSHCPETRGAGKELRGPAVNCRFRWGCATREKMSAEGNEACQAPGGGAVGVLLGREDALRDGVDVLPDHGLDAVRRDRQQLRCVSQAPPLRSGSEA